MQSYEFFEHTADIGLRVYGRDLPKLFQHGAEGLFDLVTDYSHFEISDKYSVFHGFDLHAKNVGELFLLWLKELLFLFSTKRFIFKKFEFDKLTEQKLQTKLTGAIFDPKKHIQKYELKAVTHHAFKIEKNVEGWVAEVILDI